MTRQLINVGTVANDKTGDPLRTAFSKINTNFAELYNVLGNGANITLTSTELNYSSGLTGNIQDQLDNKLNATVLAPVATSNSYSDLDNKPSLSVVSSTGSYNDLVDKPTLFNGEYSSLVNRPILSQVAITGNYNDLINKPSSGLQSRSLVFETAPAVLVDNLQFLNIAGARGYILYKITTSSPAWVRIYVSSSKRSADAGRNIMADPASDAGVIAEVITTSANETVYLTPGVVGFNDDIQSTDIYVTVTNKDNVQRDITVTLTYVTIEQ